MPRAGGDAGAARGGERHADGQRPRAPRAGAGAGRRPVRDGRRRGAGGAARRRNENRRAVVQRVWLGQQVPPRRRFQDGACNNAVTGSDLATLARADWRQGAPLSVPEGVLRDVGKALRCMHGCGVVHGDVKLANIMRRGDGFWLGDLPAVSRPTTKMLTNDPLATSVLAGGARLLCNDMWGLGLVVLALLTGPAPLRRTVARFRGILPPQVCPVFSVPECSVIGSKGDVGWICVGMSRLSKDGPFLNVLWLIQAIALPGDSTPLDSLCLGIAAHPCKAGTKGGWAEGCRKGCDGADQVSSWVTNATQGWQHLPESCNVRELSNQGLWWSDDLFLLFLVPHVKICCLTSRGIVLPHLLCPVIIWYCLGFLSRSEDGEAMAYLVAKHPAASGLYAQVYIFLGDGRLHSFLIHFAS